MSEQKNLIIAIAISVAILFGFQFFFGTSELTKKHPATPAQTAAPAKTGTAGTPTTPATKVAPGGNGAGASFAGGTSGLSPQALPAALARSGRVRIDNGTVSGSISLEGARIAEIREPIVDAMVVVPSEYIGAVMQLCEARRGDMRKMEYLSPERVELRYRLPLAEIKRLASLPEDELYVAAKDLQAPYELVREVAQAGKLPVVLFTAGGIATPADAAMMMQLGAEGVFVGSGIFKSGDPARRAEAIVKATTFYDDPDVIAKVSRGLGEAMVGINVEEVAPPHRSAGRGR